MDSQARERLQKILAQPSSISRLDQLCGLIGWGRKLFYDAGAGWVAEVTCGLQEMYRVETLAHHPQTKKGEKAGRAAAAEKAVKVLQPVAERALAQEPVALEDVFKQGVPMDILESCPSTWSNFWNVVHELEDSQRAVGVGTEGNDGTGLPILVQIAIQNLVIIEFPRACPDAQLSADLQKLLADESIMKVFCDSAKHRDIKALGLSHTSPGVVNLETVAAEKFGNASGLRGLATISGLLLGMRISKGDPSAWMEIEKHDNPRTLSDFSSKALRYAAVEAHCALRAWNEFNKLSKEQGKPAFKVIAAAGESEDTTSTSHSHRCQNGGQLSGTADSDMSNAEAADLELNAIDDELLELEAQLRALDDGTSVGEHKRPVKRKRKRKASNAPVGKWLGWKHTLDHELREAGGRLPWKKLRDVLVDRYCACSDGMGPLSRAELEMQALASIPDDYLNKRTPFVKLP